MIARFIFFFGVTFWFVRGEVTDILIEAEEMSGNGTQVIHRARASGYKAVHLEKGQSIKIEICLSSNTELTIKNLVYANDGGSDKIQVSFDEIVVGVVNTDPLMDNGQGWERFNSGEVMYTTFGSGRHILAILVSEADRYGVEVDAVHIQLNNSQSLASVMCRVFCFDEIDRSFTHPNVSNLVRARVVQKSTQTKCAEEDNVNIPVFHDNLKSYTVTASLAKYPSFENNRGPDWRNCKMTSHFWKYENLLLDQNTHTSTESSQLSLSADLTVSNGLRRISLIEVDFELEGENVGSTDWVVGTDVFVKYVRYNGSLTFHFQYLDHNDIWSTTQSDTIKNIDTGITFHTPDYSFRQGTGNKVRIEIFSDQSSAAGFSIGELYMTKRQLKGDQTTTLYKDELTIIESVDIDMWWRVNESMTVTVVNGSTVHNADYIRIYQRVPWTVDGFSQVFVMYQDGNVRLLPTTPHGLDWIPFGSSVLIGQSDPTSPRPCAPILHALIDPDLLNLKLFYADGGFASINLAATLTETQLHVSDLHFAKDPSKSPFFTLRSMFVSEGNCDVDHFSVEGYVKGIMDPWGVQEGNFFAFFRKCISAHNTQSPDISLEITEVRSTSHGFLLGSFTDINV